MPCQTEEQRKATVKDHHLHIIPSQEFPEENRQNNPHYKYEV